MGRSPTKKILEVHCETMDALIPNTSMLQAEVTNKYVKSIKSKRNIYTQIEAGKERQRYTEIRRDTQRCTTEIHTQNNQRETERDREGQKEREPERERGSQRDKRETNQDKQTQAKTN